MKYITSMIVALALTIFSGCDLNQEAGAKEETTKEIQLKKATREEFDANLAKWKSAKVSDYQFQVNMECYCFPMGWMNITVQNGQVAQVDSVPGEVKLFEPTQVALAPTIEYLFDHIDPRLDDTDYTVSVEYDANFGYPKFVEIRHTGDLKDAGLLANVVRLWPSDWVK
jgi:hypothetical protein